MHIFKLNYKFKISFYDSTPIFTASYIILYKRLYIPAFKSVVTVGTALSATGNIPTIIISIVMLIICIFKPKKKTKEFEQVKKMST